MGNVVWIWDIRAQRATLLPMINLKIARVMALRLAAYLLPPLVETAKFKPTVFIYNYIQV
ncbi:hypothetical protein E2542_SST18362 [Spatholobus suberectus]|nr:hypothetical protein E2542_SST18362 [Spatholobus suberectus]